MLNHDVVTKLKADDPERLRIMDSLGALYRVTGKYDDAARLYHLAFTGRKKTLGPDHLDTLASANNLAISYVYQGKYHEAALLF